MGADNVNLAYENFLHSWKELKWGILGFLLGGGALLLKESSKGLKNKWRSQHNTSNTFYDLSSEIIKSTLLYVIGTP